MQNIWRQIWPYTTRDGRKDVCRKDEPVELFISSLYLLKKLVYIHLFSK